MRIITSLFFFCLCTPIFAACNGIDRLADLQSEQRQELDQTIAQTPFPYGNHWKAEKPGSTIHIVGTIHVYDPRLEVNLDRLKPAIKDAGMLLVEVTTDDEYALQQRLSREPELLFITKGPTLPDLMSEDSWKKLADEARARQIPAFMAAKFQPWYLSMMLGIPPCAMSDITSGKRGLDHLIMEYAKQADIPSQSLEDTLTLFKMFSNDPIEKQVEMLEAGIAVNQDANAMFATLVEAYFREAHVEIWQYSRLHALQVSGQDTDQTAEMFDEIEELLLNRRNQAWVPVILEAAAEHETIMVAAGAAHLGGDEGVLNLLNAEGYRLTRQDF
ncbi:TraB/GumN family protein [Parasulfitobacter algicola]|uniref:TraB/GumN family protein n=1 Tax=Parasulfitobacter algicola TaxID=2614809 RepID=A0ABX2IZ15_9RHOB|nr:TraB/GumN family protein [Sulfitobacter algicola]NSX55926.1 TraB/GumN family protein [Sulfitobacter algicola]